MSDTKETTKNNGRLRRARPADKRRNSSLRMIRENTTFRSMELNKSALNASIQASTISTQKSLTLDPNADPLPSHVIGEDPFASLANQGQTVEPPFDMLTLTTLPEHNSELVQTIEAMETNIDATGHRFVCRIDVDNEDVTEETKKAVKSEYIRLQNFFMYATYESFPEFRMKLRNDKESSGCCYFEVIRDTAGNISGFTHMPAYQVRIGRLEDEPYLADRKILQIMEDESVEVVTVKQWRRFRKFVQSRFISSRGNAATVQGHKVRWYKEFGDPREYDSRTGDILDTEDKKNKVPLSLRANEVIYRRRYSPRTPYGLPRFIGNLLSIFGDRASEEINYVTFRNNNIPSMAVLCSNGQLTEGTIERIESFVESQIQGSDNYSKFLIIEAESAEEDGLDGNNIKVDIKTLTSDQHKDALFQSYSKNNQDKVRRAFRLPPIFVGRSDDYTRSTAESSRRLADEQVFAPERMAWDEFMNRIVFPEMGIVYHKYKSNTPNTTDNEQLVKILAGAEKTGGMTPRIARLMLEDILGQSLPGFPRKNPNASPDDPDVMDPDVPFSLTMAKAVKNQADASEPGQQVTALKALGVLDNDDNIVKSAEQLVRLSAKVDDLWRKKESVLAKEDPGEE